ncbi:hypothetical protein MMC19_001414 [Ptychographa xylographoides]|nr:hypothetical protein [Ptychographa xylographoides]
MSHPFPHPTHAEDQPLGKTILTIHVLHRGFQTGALLGLGTGSVRAALLRRASRPTSPSSPPAITTPATPLAPTSPPKPALPAWPLLLRFTGTGALVGTAVAGLMLAGRMYGKETIEWQDRSWRLLEHRGQMEVDAFSVAGMAGGVVGLVAVGVATGRSGVDKGMVGWRGRVGAVGVGSLVGLVGYFGWRG